MNLRPALKFQVLDFTLRLMIDKTKMAIAQEKKLRVRTRLALPAIAADSAVQAHCYLCGCQDTPLEIEHVIPKVLFAPIPRIKTAIFLPWTALARQANSGYK